MVSVTQATELSTVYALDELAAIHDACSRHGLRLHMDGARFANAVAALCDRRAACNTQDTVDGRTPLIAAAAMG